MKAMIQKRNGSTSGYNQSFGQQSKSAVGLIVGLFLRCAALCPWYCSREAILKNFAIEATES